MKAIQYNNTISQAEAYIAANRSDPFTRNRVYSHIANGLCDDRAERDNSLRDCRYRAEAYEERRFLPPSPLHPEGQEYFVTVYRNLQQP